MHSKGSFVIFERFSLIRSYDSIRNGKDWLGFSQIAISVSVVALLQSKLAALATLPTPAESSRAMPNNLMY
jgi:hypothetical protein